MRIFLLKPDDTALEVRSWQMLTGALDYESDLEAGRSVAAKVFNLAGNDAEQPQVVTLTCTSGLYAASRKEAMAERTFLHAFCLAANRLQLRMQDGTVIKTIGLSAMLAFERTGPGGGSYGDVLSVRWLRLGTTPFTPPYPCAHGLDPLLEPTVNASALSGTPGIAASGLGPVYKDVYLHPFTDLNFFRAYIAQVGSNLVLKGQAVENGVWGPEVTLSSPLNIDVGLGTALSLASFGYNVSSGGADLGALILVSETDGYRLVAAQFYQDGYGFNVTPLADYKQYFSGFVEPLVPGAVFAAPRQSGIGSNPDLTFSVLAAMQDTMLLQEYSLETSGFSFTLHTLTQIALPSGVTTVTQMIGKSDINPVVALKTNNGWYMTGAYMDYNSALERYTFADGMNTYLLTTNLSAEVVVSANNALAYKDGANEYFVFVRQFQLTSPVTINYNVVQVTGTPVQGSSRVVETFFTTRGLSSTMHIQFNDYPLRSYHFGVARLSDNSLYYGLWSFDTDTSSNPSFTRYSTSYPPSPTAEIYALPEGGSGFCQANLLSDNAYYKFQYHVEY